MTPNYTARKSIPAHISLLLIILSPFTLGITLIVQICRILKAASYSIEFYDDRIIAKKGVINRSEQSSVFMGVYSVSIRQSLFGRMFNYGDLNIDCVGKWDVSTTKLKNPYALKAYLETRVVRGPQNTMIFN